MRSKGHSMETLEGRTLMSSVQAVGSTFTLGGTPYSANGLVNYVGRKVVADNQGNVLEMWVDDTRGTVVVQSFHPDGTPRSAVFDTGLAYNTSEENIAISGDGKSFAMTWAGGSSSNFSVETDYARLFSISTPTPGSGIDSQIAAKTAAFKTPESSKVSVANSYVAMDYSGNAVVAWMVASGKNNLTNYNAIHAQQYNSTGAAVGSLINVSTLSGTHKDVAISMNRTPGVTGNFVIAWTDIGPDNADGSAGAYARVFSSGAPVSAADTRLNEITAGDQSMSTVTMGADGKFIAAWTSPDGDGNGQYVGRFDANGHPLDATTPTANDVLVNDQAAGNQFRGRVAIASNGDFTITWCQGDPTGSGTADVYGQAFAANGSRIGSNFAVGTNDGLYLDIVAQPNDAFVITWGDHTQSSIWGTGTTWGQEYQILA